MRFDVRRLLNNSFSISLRGLVRAGRRTSFALAVGVAVFLASGCASTRNSSRPFEPTPHAPAERGVGELNPEIMGPPESQPAYGPEQPEKTPLTVILGPGMARSFAAAGVLRALAENKIPVGAIVGTETGALIAALYSIDAKINGFEWRMMKFKNDAFVSSGILSRFLKSPGFSSKKLEVALERVFGATDLAKSKVPTRVSFRNSKTGEFYFLGEGETAKLLLAALSGPDWRDPANWQGAPAESAAFSRPFPVSEAKTLVGGPVLVVDTMISTPSESSAADADAEKKLFLSMQKSKLGARQDLEQADLVIRPQLTGIGYRDYHKRSEAAFQGKRAAIEAMPQIRRLAGMAEPMSGRGARAGEAEEQYSP